MNKANRFAIALLAVAIAPYFVQARSRREIKKTINTTAA